MYKVFSEMIGNDRTGTATGRYVHWCINPSCRFPHDCQFVVSAENSEPPSTSLTMVEESQASFSASVRNKIREIYQYRCVICLAWIDMTQCAHLLDTATQGEFQVRSEVMV